MVKQSYQENITIVMENLEYGGATTHLISLINNKRFKKNKFTIITNKNNFATKNILNSCDMKNLRFIYYHSFNLNHFKNIFLKSLFFFVKPFLFLISIIQMLFVIKKVKFDIILANCGGYGDFRTEMACIFACKLLGKKNLHLLIHHSYTKPKLWSYLIDFLNLFIGRFLDGLIFVSFATKKSIEFNTRLLDSFRYQASVIHNGIHLRKIKKVKKLKNLSTKKNLIKIGMLSRIERYKGQVDLIKGFSKLPDKKKSKYKIFFVGNGEKKELTHLKNMVSKLRLKKYVKIVKYINKDSLLIIKNFDLLFSLTRDFEGFGYSIAEALYLGVPVVSTKVGGVTEFLNTKNATLIKPKDINSIKKILVEFLIKRKNFKYKSLNGKKLIIKKFNSDLMTSKFYDYFKKTYNRNL